MDNQQEGSLQTIHTSGSGYQRKGHAMHEQGDEKAMQREIDDLKKQFRRAQRKQSHLVSLFPVRRSIFTKEGAGVHYDHSQ